MDVQELMSKARDSIAVSKVYAPPVERDGITVITAARIAGGGGGGTGQDENGQEGEGGGFGLIGKPAGAFVIDGGKLRWQPAVDANQVIAAVAAVVITVVIARALTASRRG
jgi:uncharacterized spore protein YtfJ